eukprot:GILK01012196.1.p1 GENE.GILK01012196.1~~GILK01012196.1.p1  ORF type:complete len:880 (+),score=135.42 GILK01012196.1:82-2640(+)
MAALLIYPRYKLVTLRAEFMRSATETASVNVTPLKSSRRTSMLTPVRQLEVLDSKEKLVRSPANHKVESLQTKVEPTSITSTTTTENPQSAKSADKDTSPSPVNHAPSPAPPIHNVPAPSIQVKEPLFVTSLSEIPPHLIEEIKSGNCIAFVGAGFSAAAGFPTWATLIHRLNRKAFETDYLDVSTYEHVVELLSSPAAFWLDQAAQILEDALGRKIFAEMLAEEFVPEDPLPAAMTERIRLLKSIPFRAILTTNFDGLLLDHSEADPHSHFLRTRASVTSTSGESTLSRQLKQISTLSELGEVSHRSSTVSADLTDAENFASNQHESDHVRSDSAVSSFSECSELPELKTFGRLPRGSFDLNDWSNGINFSELDIEKRRESVGSRRSSKFDAMLHSFAKKTGSTKFRSRRSTVESRHMVPLTDSSQPAWPELTSESDQSIPVDSPFDSMDLRLTQRPLGFGMCSAASRNSLISLAPSSDRYTNCNRRPTNGRNGSMMSDSNISSSLSYGQDKQRHPAPRCLDEAIHMLNHLSSSSNNRSRPFREILRPQCDRNNWWEEVWRAEFHSVPVFQLHGCVCDPESIVCTRDAYRRLLHSDSSYNMFLKSLMATCTILYIGFSFMDVYLNEFRSEIMSMLGEDIKRHPIAYAITPDKSTQHAAFFRRHEGVHLLTWDTQNGLDFSGLEKYLMKINEQTNPLYRFGGMLKDKRILWVDSSRSQEYQNVADFLEKAKAEYKKSAVVDAAVTSSSCFEYASSAEQAVSAVIRSSVPFDLIITQYGVQIEGQPTSVLILSAMRSAISAAQAAPVIVFSLPFDMDKRKREVLRLGALNYCVTMKSLLQSIERVFAPAGISV